MRIARLAVMAAALAACRPSAPPAAPTPDALAAELATFPQFLVPLSTQALAGLAAAAERAGGPEHVRPSDFSRSYGLVEAALNGKTARVVVAYANPWLAPADTYNQPMSAAQFFRVCENEPNSAAAVLVAPKGEIVVVRESFAAVRQKLVALGRSHDDLPVVLIRGSRR